MAVTPTTDELRALVERLDSLCEHASFEPSTFGVAAVAIRLWIAEREQEEHKVTKPIQRMDINS